MVSQVAHQDGLPPDLPTYKMTVARHALDAMQDRGITMLDVVSALRAPPSKVRRDIKTGHYVVRDQANRIVLRVDNSAKSVDVITVTRAGS